MTEHTPQSQQGQEMGFSQLLLKARRNSILTEESKKRRKSLIKITQELQKDHTHTNTQGASNSSGMVNSFVSIGQSMHTNQENMFQSNVLPQNNFYSVPTQGQVQTIYMTNQTNYGDYQIEQSGLTKIGQLQNKIIDHTRQINSFQESQLAEEKENYPRYNHFNVNLQQEVQADYNHNSFSQKTVQYPFFQTQNESSPSFNRINLNHNRESILSASESYTDDGEFIIKPTPMQTTNFTKQSQFTDQQYQEVNNSNSENRTLKGSFIVKTDAIPLLSQFENSVASSKTSPNQIYDSNSKKQENLQRNF